MLTIGDELTRGEIVDTNSSWLAGRLTDLGAHVRWKTSVTDDSPDIEAALRTACARAAVVVCSGGLGPTDDDRTVDTVARLVGVEPVVDPAHEQKMRARFAERGFRVTENNIRQVRVPSGAEVLANSRGLAPGFSVSLDGARLFFMPGVPREMKAIFEEHVAVQVREALGQAGVHTVRRVLRVMGMGESHVDAALEHLLDGVADATVHYRIAFPEIFVTIVIRRRSEADGLTVADTLETRARQALGSSLYGIDEETLAQVVGRALSARGETLSTAESCTGGLIGHLVTAVPGSSGYFLGGIVSYANEVKRDLLGVSSETLETMGAVSAACVREMAEGARRALGTTWAVSVSGIAGPDGGTAEKPIGTVELAVAGPAGTIHRQIRAFGDREQVRLVAAHSALHLLWKQIRALGSSDT